MSVVSSMKAQFLVALLLATQASAQHAPWWVAKRVPGYGNDTYLYTNSTTLSTPSITTTSTSSSQTTTQPVTTSLATTSRLASQTFSSISSSTTTSPAGGESSSGTGTPSIDPGVGNGDGGNCASTVTYHGSVYPTVFVTITEGFAVTLTDFNSMTESETLITPEQACSSTVVPIDAALGKFTVQATVLMTYTTSDDSSSSSSSSSAFSTLTPFGNNTLGLGPRPSSSVMTAPANPTNNGKPNPGAQPDAPPDNGLGEDVTWSVIDSTVYSTGAPYTSTVIVTKKTPVAVLPNSVVTPPDFRDPSPPPAGPAAAPTGGSGGNNVPVGGGGGNNNQPQPGQQRPGPGSSPPTASIKTFLPQTTINNVPIAVRPSVIIIGQSTVAIPTGGPSASAIVTQQGVEFTVRPSEIIAPSTTIGLRPLGMQQANPVSVAPTRVTAAPGVVVAVSGSEAVVAGTTYRIASDFSTVFTVSGARISIGPSGVALPQTTIVPGSSGGSAAGAVGSVVLVTSVGSVTFTISGDDVVIGGSTYGIASGDPIVRTTVDGQSVSIGPGGVGFASTTVLPPDATDNEEVRSGGSSSATSTASSTAEAEAAAGSISVHRIELVVVLLASCAVGGLLL